MKAVCRYDNEPDTPLAPCPNGRLGLDRQAGDDEALVAGELTGVLARVPLGAGHDAFRDYFVVQTREMLRSYAEHVAPGVDAADAEALERIGERWRLSGEDPQRPYTGPVLARKVREVLDA